MSGVYIPNMKMPESCDVCWAEYSYEICNSHSENCPLIPVPDHGRLIDADVLEADNWHLQRYMTTPTGCWIESKMLKDAPTIIPASGGKEVEDMLENAPTIIPADKEAGE